MKKKRYLNKAVERMSEQVEALQDEVERLLTEIAEKDAQIAELRRLRHLAPVSDDPEEV